MIDSAEQVSFHNTTPSGHSQPLDLGYTMDTQRIIIKVVFNFLAHFFSFG